MRAGYESQDYEGGWVGWVGWVGPDLGLVEWDAEEFCA